MTQLPDKIEIPVELEFGKLLVPVKLNRIYIANTISSWIGDDTVEAAFDGEQLVLAKVAPDSDGTAMIHILSSDDADFSERAINATLKLFDWEAMCSLCTDHYPALAAVDEARWVFQGVLKREDADSIADRLVRLAACRQCIEPLAKVFDVFSEHCVDATAFMASRALCKMRRPL